MIYRLIDNDGNFIKDVVLNEQPTIDVETIVDGEVFITKQPNQLYVSQAPKGLFKPKWNGTLWVESMAQVEIDNLIKVNRMREIEERLKELDIKTFKFVDGELSQAQYEPYRLEKIALRNEYNLLEQ